jgi:hypothetical protein
MREEVREMLERYRMLAHVHAATDYANRGSVKKANAAVDGMIEISQGLSLLGPEALEAFAPLLDEPQVQIWAAHHILEHANPSEQLQQRAQAVIRSHADGSGPDAFGERLWLKEWEANRT